MDMQTPRQRGEPTIGELLETLVEEGGDLIAAEARIVEAKVTRRLQKAALPLGLLSASVALGLIALMAVAATIVVALGPAIGFVGAVLTVAVLTAGAAYALFAIGSKKLEAVFDMKSDRKRKPKL